MRAHAAGPPLQQFSPCAQRPAQPPAPPPRLRLLSFISTPPQIPPAPPELAEWGSNTMMVASFGAIYTGLREWRTQAAGVHERRGEGEGGL